MTSDDVLGCQSCLLVANSATVEKMQQLFGISEDDLLTHVFAIHFQQEHEARESQLAKLGVAR